VREGLALLAPAPEVTRQLARLRFAAGAGFPGLPDLSDPALAGVLLDGAGVVRSLDSLDLGRLIEGLLAGIDRRRLDARFPAWLETPAGSRHAIDYGAQGGPAVEVRVQALFGLATHPRAGETPLVLHLASPAGRVMAVTRDLPGFWRTGWKEVQREMKGRYPKHPWPDDPAASTATLRSKAADARRA